MTRPITTTNICLHIALALLAATAVAADRTHPEQVASLARLAEETENRVQIKPDPATGSPALIVIADGALKLSGNSSKARFADFLTRFGDAFGIDDPARDLVFENSRSDRLGSTHLRWTQRYFDVPVFAAEIRAHFNPTGELYAVNGSLVPHLDLNPIPDLDAIAASDIARRVTGKTFGSVPEKLHAADPELLIHRTGRARGVHGSDHLVWKVEVGDGAGVREFIFVDAHTGAVVDRITGIHEIQRVIHHRSFPRPIWNEGDTLPYSNADFTTEKNDEVNDLISVSMDTYQLFSNITGGEFLSYDGFDRQMNAVYEAAFNPPCDESINASWNGRTTNFCVGLAVDDVIAHEWTHAYTDFTHNLIYAWQPGALNESYSDIFGEIVDMLNGQGLDQPDTRRSENGCSVFFGSPYPRLSVASPATIAGDFDARGAVFNPQAPWTETGFVEFVNDGAGTATGDACEPLQGFTSGRIALIDRGSCPFRDKVVRASEAGAIAAVIANNDQERPDSVLVMGGDLPVLDMPAVFISFNAGQRLKSELNAGVQATVSLDRPSDSSVRWLVSEDGAAGAFRDMWNPNCMGDPGRVSDSAYFCLEDDGGGVHSNSGIPNHAFALLVDGGTYNGVTVQGIGLTRAAAIYWRAMHEYQVPTTKFADHADLLELSCNDLRGATLTDLTTGEPSGQTVRATDCNQLRAAVLATEMRLDPTQCGFETILDPETPPLGAVDVVYSTEFDDAASLAEWTFTNRGVYPEYDGNRNWRSTTFLPGDRSGSALFAINNSFIGNCQPDDNDQSGVLMAESPTITLPASASSLYLSFEHYVATEKGWDGGNLKLSVNGGDYELVPASAFAFNPYNDAVILSSIDEEQNEVFNTNPLAGEPAFTGVDQGEVEGSWGQSQIDLAALASPGDSIRVRFDFGNDGCTGVEGWYIDVLEVVAGSRPAASVQRPSRRVSP